MAERQTAPHRELARARGAETPGRVARPRLLKRAETGEATWERGVHIAEGWSSAIDTLEGMRSTHFATDRTAIAAEEAFKLPQNATEEEKQAMERCIGAEAANRQTVISALDIHTQALQAKKAGTYDEATGAYHLDAGTPDPKDPSQKLKERVDGNINMSIKGVLFGLREAVRRNPSDAKAKEALNALTPNTVVVTGKGVYSSEMYQVALRREVIKAKGGEDAWKKLSGEEQDAAILAADTVSYTLRVDSGTNTSPVDPIKQSGAEKFKEHDELLKKADEAIDEIVDYLKRGGNQNAPLLAMLFAAKAASGPYGDIRALLKFGAIREVIMHPAGENGRFTKVNAIYKELQERASLGVGKLAEVCKGTGAFTEEEMTELSSAATFGKLPASLETINQIVTDMGNGADPKKLKKQIENLTPAQQKFLNNPQARKAINMALFGKEEGLTWEDIQNQVHDSKVQGILENWKGKGRKAAGLLAILALLLAIYGMTSSNEGMQQQQAA